MWTLVTVLAKRSFDVASVATKTMPTQTLLAISFGPVELGGHKPALAEKYATTRSFCVVSRSSALDETPFLLADCRHDIHRHESRH